VGVAVFERVRVGVRERVDVKLAKGVLEGVVVMDALAEGENFTVGEMVKVSVGARVRVGVGVSVGVGVRVGVGVSVGVRVRVDVGVGVSVIVEVELAVGVGDLIANSRSLAKVIYAGGTSSVGSARSAR
jgi:NF-X1-type zinc finger protein NFXL1